MFDFGLADINISNFGCSISNLEIKIKMVAALLQY